MPSSQYGATHTTIHPTLKQNSRSPAIIRVLESYHSAITVIAWVFYLHNIRNSQLSMDLRRRTGLLLGLLVPNLATALRDSTSTSKSSLLNSNAENMLLLLRQPPLFMLLAAPPSDFLPAFRLFTIVIRDVHRWGNLSGEVRRLPGENLSAFEWENISHFKIYSSSVLCSLHI